MSDDSVSGDSVFLFWIGPIGAALVTLGITFPNTESCRADPTTFLAKCDNYLGFEAITLSSAGSFVVAAVVGLICAAFIEGYKHLTRSGTES